MANTVLVLSLIFCVGITLCSSGKCGKVFENKINREDQNIIVNKHNSLRALISNGRIVGQPKGKNLKTLKWDSQLAKQAQRIANSCVFAHVKVNDNRFYVGQNLGWTASTASTRGAEWNDVIQRWFNEYKDFRYPNKSKDVTGHYTQVVWADTYLIGCGFTMYRKNIWYEKLYVCNYGPGGNVVGRPPYQIV